MSEFPVHRLPGKGCGLGPVTLEGVPRRRGGGGGGGVPFASLFSFDLAERVGGLGLGSRICSEELWIRDRGCRGRDFVDGSEPVYDRRGGGGVGESLCSLGLTLLEEFGVV